MGKPLKASVWILALLLCACFAGAAGSADSISSGKVDSSPSTDQGVPTLVINETVHDFGEILQGDYISHEFKLKNTGTAVLEIKKIVPD